MPCAWRWHPRFFSTTFMPSLDTKNLWILGGLDPEFAVRGFFVISGFLIAGSARKAGASWIYWKNRALRILPAYWMALAVGVAVAFTCTPQLDWSDLVSRGTLRYLAANLAFLNFLAPDISPAFEQNTYTAFNGSLWTIKIEVGFYLLAPWLVKLFSFRRPWLWLAVLYLLSVTWTAAPAPMA